MRTVIYGKPFTPAGRVSATKGQKPNPTHHCTKEAGYHLTKLIINEAKQPHKQRAETDRSASGQN